MKKLTAALTTNTLRTEPDPCRQTEPMAKALHQRPRSNADRTAGLREEIQFVIGETTLGLVLVANSTRGLCAVLLGGDQAVLQRDLQDRFPNAMLIAGDAELNVFARPVIELIEAPSSRLEAPLDLRGTEFQLTVWDALREIPTGTTASYTDIAHRIGRPNAARGVAQACGANALAVVIPCHRVVRSDGTLSGYRWGAERKQALLEREAEMLPAVSL